MKKDFKFDRCGFNVRKGLAILLGASLLFCLWMGHPGPQFAASLSSVVDRDLSEGQAWQVSSLLTDFILEDLDLGIDRPFSPIGVDPAAHEEIQSPLPAGLALYPSEDIRGAIDPWERATAESSAPPVFLWQYRARADQPIVQVNQSIAHGDRLINHDRQIGDRQGLNRMLVEQVPAYSSLWQHREAIALLCGKETAGGGCQDDSAQEIARSLTIARTAIIPPSSSTSNEMDRD